MSDYPIIIVGINVKDLFAICSEFEKNNPIHHIERKGHFKWKIISNGKEYWIMHENYYEEWCKGRTYYKDGKLMHSNYELKEQKNDIRK